MTLFLAVLWAVSAGGLLSVGGAANARLSDALHSAVAAATVNFLVGATTLTLVLVLGGFAPVPLERFDGIPPWALTGGMLGALHVTLLTLLIPRLGLTTTTMIVVLSQLVGSLGIDHWGWLGVSPQPIGPARWLVALRRSDGGRSLRSSGDV